MTEIKASSVKTWVGDAPTECDLCSRKIVNAFVDGRIVNIDQWGCMCLECHARYGCGLGVGNGQQYEKQQVTKDPSTDPNVTARTITTLQWVKVQG